MKTILGIYGAGGLGREVLELARIIDKAENCWRDIVFIDDGDVPAEINGATVHEYKSFIAQHANELEIAIAIGEPAVKKTVCEKVQADGIRLATLIHPDVHIPNSTTIGAGTVINMGCFISCNAAIGQNVFIQPHANIGHDCILEDGCVISGFCNIAGAVRVGKESYLGLSVAVKEGVIIGDSTIVGMSASVVRDIPDSVIALGNPARVMKENAGKRVFKH